MPMFSVLVSSIARITSPEQIPALYAGPLGEAEITTSPDDDPSFPVGYPIDSPTPVRELFVPDCLQRTF